jgi:hypothetical protein
MKKIVKLLSLFFAIVFIVSCSELPNQLDKPSLYQTPESLMDALRSGKLQSSAENPLVAVAFENGVVVSREKYVARVFEVEKTKGELGFTYQYMNLSVAQQKYSDQGLNFQASSKAVETSVGGMVHIAYPYTDSKSLSVQFDTAAYYRCVQMSIQGCLGWPPGFMRTGCMGGVAAYCVIVAGG